MLYGILNIYQKLKIYTKPTPIVITPSIRYVYDIYLPCILLNWYLSHVKVLADPTTHIVNTKNKVSTVIQRSYSLSMMLMCKLEITIEFKCSN